MKENRERERPTVVDIRRERKTYSERQKKRRKDR
jgi:hypothetical protein